MALDYMKRDTYLKNIEKYDILEKKLTD